MVLVYLTTKLGDFEGQCIIYGYIYIYVSYLYLYLYLCICICTMLINISYMEHMGLNVYPFPARPWDRSETPGVDGKTKLIVRSPKRNSQVVKMMMMMMMMMLMLMLMLMTCISMHISYIYTPSHVMSRRRYRGWANISPGSAAAAHEAVFARQSLVFWWRGG